MLAASGASTGSARAAWSTRAIEPGVALSGISCPSASLCVVTDTAGNVLTSSNPTSGAWSQPIHVGQGANPRLAAVSCSSATLCVAVGNNGYVYWSTTPGAWTANFKQIDPGHALEAVSCVGAWCVATDDRGVVFETNSAPGGAWASKTIDSGHQLPGVSCIAVGTCIAVDDNGSAFVGAGWTRRSIGGSMRAVSCASSWLCAAVDTLGNVKSSNIAFSATFAWRYDTVAPGHALNAVSCPADGHDTTCLAVDDSGNALTSARLGTASSTTVWARTNLGTTDPLTGVSCLPTDQCFVVDSSGTLLWGAVPPANEAEPTVVGDTTKSLQVTCDRGTWRGDSLALAYQWFADGAAIAGATGTTYTAKPNGVYLKCRVTASNGDGSASAESDEVQMPEVPGFSGPVRVDGTPAAGHTFECTNEGIYGTDPVTDHLQWLRDGRKIAGERYLTYIVADGDAGHLITCTWQLSNRWGTSRLVTAPAVRISTASGPRLRAIRLASTRFTAARSGPTITRTGRSGVVLTITLTRKATVTFTIERATLGRRQGSRCLADTAARRKLKRCTYYVALKGTARASGKTGVNTWRFTGRLGGHALKPGAYRLVAVARAANGAIGPTVRVSFTIKR